MSKTPKRKPDPATRAGTSLIIASPAIWTVGMATAFARCPLDSVWVAAAGIIITTVGIITFLNSYEIADAFVEYVELPRHRCNDDC